MDAREKRELDLEIALLAEALQLRAKRLVREHLVATRCPQSSFDIAKATGLPLISVARALLDLFVNDRVRAVGTDSTGAIVFRPVEVGRCEWCGVVSHSLVAGECPDHQAPVH